MLAPVLLAAMEGEKFRPQKAPASRPQQPSSKDPQQGLMTYQEASDLATWVMEIAYLIRRSVYKRIKYELLLKPLCGCVMSTCWLAECVCVCVCGYVMSTCWLAVCLAV